MSTLLIKNGRVITAVDDYFADVFIDGETIAVIGRSLELEADVVIDAAGRYLFPGGVDPHTHMDMPFGGTTSADDFETGTRAAPPSPYCRKTSWAALAPMPARWKFYVNRFL
jgi:dihydropyrimidinase